MQVTSPSMLFQDDCSKCFLTLLVLENIYSCLVDSYIEKILLEIHGQFIAGSELAQFLDQAKVSVTGAGNVVVNVFPN